MPGFTDKEKRDVLREVVEEIGKAVLSCQGPKMGVALAFSERENTHRFIEKKRLNHVYEVLTECMVDYEKIAA